MGRIRQLLALAAACCCAPFVAGQAPARVVRTATDLQFMLDIQSPRVTIEADLNATAVSPLPQRTPRAYIFPVYAGTEWILGNCNSDVSSPESSSCRITASADASLFGITSSATKVWIHNLNIILVRRWGAESVVAIDVLRGAWVWATRLTIFINDSGGYFPERDVGAPSRDGNFTRYYDYDWDDLGFLDPEDSRFPSMLVVHAGPRARVLVADANIYLQNSTVDGVAIGDEPKVMRTSGDGTVAFLLTQFASDPDNTGLFTVESCRGDRLRLLGCSFICSSDPRSEATRTAGIVLETPPPASCAGANASTGPRSAYTDVLQDQVDGGPWVGGIPLADLGSIPYSPDGGGVCGGLRGEFLNGTEAELVSMARDTGFRLEEVMWRALALSEELSCISVMPACLEYPDGSDFTSDMFFVLYNLLTFVIVSVLFMSIICCCCWCCRSVATTAAITRDTDLFFTNEMVNFDILMNSPHRCDEPHEFEAPVEDANCSCTRFAAGDTSCLLCQLCENAYSNAAPTASMGGPDRRPKSLPCGHSVCAACADTIDTFPAYAGYAWARHRKYLLPINYAAVELLSLASQGSVLEPDGPRLPSATPRATPRVTPRATSWAAPRLPPLFTPRAAPRATPRATPRSFRAGMVLPAPEAPPAATPKAGTATPKSGAAASKAAVQPLWLPTDAPLTGRGDGGGRSEAAAPAVQPSSKSFSGLVSVVQRSVQNLVSLANFGGTPRSSRRTQAALRWRPDEDAFFCPICYGLLSPSSPEDNGQDMRPVVFPCGHGACADCASKIRHRGMCYKRCEWLEEDRRRPFCINHLVVSMMEVAEKHNYSVVLVLSKNTSQRTKAGLAQELQTVE